MTPNRIALALTLLLVSTLAGADAYKCRTIDGRIEFSNSPCASGSSTVKSQPDEKIPETERQRAEKDLERMRDYVEKREASQRADAAAEREAAARQAQAAPRVYGSADECLRDIGQMGLENGQRSQLEAECRHIKSPQTIYVPYPVAVPAHGRVVVQPNPVPAAPPNTPPASPRNLRANKEKVLPIYEAAPRNK